MDVEGLGRPPPVLVPDVVDQLLAAAHRTGIGSEEHEQVVLLRRQVDRGALELDHPAAAVDVERADAQLGWRVGC